MNAVEKLNQPGRITTLAGDITQPETSDNIISEAVGRFSQVDVLVNNAGIFQTKPFTEYTLEELDANLGYLRGTFVLTQAAVRQMRKQGTGGAIINISTILTLTGVAGIPSSAPIAAKGYLNEVINQKKENNHGVIWNLRKACDRSMSME